MVARGGGHIVNIGSIAGRQVYENGAVYCASKHAVNALSQGMRIDLVRHGIRVTEVRPGMVETEFSEVRFHGDESRAAAVYQGVEPLTAEDVAEAVVWAATRPPHVNIDEIALTPRQQANAYYTYRK
jgi:NADP-dependent 3-hydroxy acid dehydrogenase YdfG